jgi:integrase
VFPDDMATGFSWAKERLTALAAIAPWTYHDLRRSAASHMGDEILNVNIHVIERLLNHTGESFKGIVGNYQRQKYQKSARAAMESWARYITRLLSPQSADVISLDQRRGV